MAQENVELVKALVAGLQNSEAMALLASGELDLDLFDPEVEWDASRLEEMIPDLAGVYHGHEGVREYWARWFEAWRDLEFAVDDIRDSGDEVVVLIRDQRQWGRHSGIPTQLPPWGMVFTFRRRKVSRWRTFPDHQSALEAVGLSE